MVRVAGGLEYGIEAFLVKGKFGLGHVIIYVRD